MSKASWSSKTFGLAPLPDPIAGVTIVEPLSSGPGWWAGAPGAFYDAQTKAFYLYYRLRKPRHLGRGAECRIARSTDGFAFNTIWQATKDDLASPSVERSAIFRGLDGIWRLYVSYVDPEDSRWRIDVIEARSPEAFRPQDRRPIFTAGQLGIEGIKDPCVLNFGGLYYMIVSYAPRPVAVTDQQRSQMHATADVYNTGITRSHSGLALSYDGMHFDWQGDIFSPRDRGWDAYAARIGCLVYIPPVFTAFYDGSQTVAGNYEERTGLAISLDLKTFHRLSCDGPALVSPHASGSLRYLDAVQLEDAIFYYYEYARPDGSHELRANRVVLG